MFALTDCAQNLPRKAVATSLGKVAISLHHVATSSELHSAQKLQVSDRVSSIIFVQYI